MVPMVPIFRSLTKNLKRLVTIDSCQKLWIHSRLHFFVCMYNRNYFQHATAVHKAVNQRFERPVKVNRCQWSYQISRFRRKSLIVDLNYWSGSKMNIITTDICKSLQLSDILVTYNRCSRRLFNVSSKNGLLNNCSIVGPQQGLFCRVHKCFVN